MPVLPVDVQRRSKRFAAQRWLLDAVIKTIGVEWDQGRIAYLGAPCGNDAFGDFAGLRMSIKKYDEIAREFTKVARRKELRAKKELALGHTVTAREAYFAAAILYGGGQWPIQANTPFNLALERKKTECYLAYAAIADHLIERVEIPYRGQHLPGYLHLPPGYTGGALPCVLMISGMDGFKEMSIAVSGDRILTRGFACLVLDGPGQGEALTREIWYDPANYGECGTAAFDWLAQRPEIDAARIVVHGISFGSFWATQLAAAEPRFAACAVAYTCHEPKGFSIFEMASPTFKLRFMYMTDIHDEAAFDAFAARITTAGLGEKIACPYLVIAGEDDDLSDIAYTYDLLNTVTSPKQLLLYAGDAHSPHTARSGQLGPRNLTYATDWMRDRVDGKPMASEYIVVDSGGNLQAQPWGTTRSYEYGAPLDFRQLFGEGPGTGTA